jgi:ComF family protein
MNAGELLPPRRIPSILRPFYEFLFPPACCVCGAALPAAGASLCALCASRVQLVTLDDAVYRQTITRLCSRGVLDHLVALAYFARGGVIQELLHRLKYAGATIIGEQLGRNIGGRIGELPEGFRGAVLVPVPLYRSRRRERGYNQSEAVARGIAAVTGLAVEAKLLVRVRPTRSQTGLRVDERRTNMAGAFSLHRHAPSSLKGRTFILVDDVLTTGSTLESCAAVLRDHGASAVAAAVIAIAPLDSMLRTGR